MRIILCIQASTIIICITYIILSIFADIKPDNILVNYGQGDIRFTDFKLADCGSTVPSDSAYAKDGDLIGAPVWRSPEAQLRFGWGTPTDIWSFGALVRS